GDANLAAEAERLLDDESPLVRGASVWALSRLDRDRLRACAKTRRDNEADPELIAEWAAALGEARQECAHSAVLASAIAPSTSARNSAASSITSSARCAAPSVPRF